MYWNELNPQKRNVHFKFDNTDLKKDKERVLVKIKTNISNFFHLFFSSSNIHGFNHLTDESRHLIEKYVLFYIINLNLRVKSILHFYSRFLNFKFESIRKQNCNSTVS